MSPVDKSWLIGLSGLLLAACSTASQEPGGTVRVPQGNAMAFERAVQLFEGVCGASRPDFTSMTTLEKQVVLPGENVVFRTTTIAGGKPACTMAAMVSNAESIDGKLRERYGPVKDTGAANLRFIESRQFGNLFFVPKAQMYPSQKGGPQKDVLLELGLVSGL